MSKTFEEVWRALSPRERAILNDYLFPENQEKHDLFEHFSEKD